MPITFLHEEAAEILAFLAADSSRISIKGIPCHLPIAYGTQGPHTNNVSDEGDDRGCQEPVSRIQT